MSETPPPAGYASLQRSGPFIHLGRPPAVRLKIINRRVRLEIRLNNPPGRFEAILAHEEHRVVGLTSPTNPLIGVRNVDRDRK